MAPQTPRGEYAEIAQIIQSTLEPLMSKLDAKVDRLEVKVDHLTQDRVTRADVEKLRSELQANLVPRDSYEARHAALIQRDTDIEARLKQTEDRTQAELQRVHDRLENGKKQIEERFEAGRVWLENYMKEQHNTQLNDKDRHWIRFSQFFGVIAVIITIIDMLMNHVKFQ